MIALQSESWERDRSDFEAAGLTLPEPFSFSRMAAQPDGSEVEMGFDLTFVPRAVAPDAMFFTCQHRHAPAHFYKPDYQHHANGATRITSVTIETPDTNATAGFLKALGVDETLFKLVEAADERLAGFEIAVAGADVPGLVNAFGVDISFCEENE